jgi:hypothetical protein
MKTEKLNLKSDVPAKEAFKIFLENKKEYGSVKITNSPADITAIKNDEKYFFEIKFTRQEKNYFGAATLTEWRAALENPNRFWFVIAIKRGEIWEFKEYSPSQFIRFNTIPPFKTYFNLSMSKDTQSKRITKSVRLTEKNIKKMIEFMESLKQ